MYVCGWMDMIACGLCDSMFVCTNTGTLWGGGVENKTKMGFYTVSLVGGGDKINCEVIEQNEKGTPPPPRSMDCNFITLNACITSTLIS